MRARRRPVHWLVRRRTESQSAPFANHVPVAQLDRVSASEAEGYWFESSRGYFYPSALAVGATRCRPAALGAKRPSDVGVYGVSRIAVSILLFCILLIGVVGVVGAIWCDPQRLRREAFGTIFGAARIPYPLLGQRTTDKEPTTLRSGVVSQLRNRQR